MAKSSKKAAAPKKESALALKQENAVVAKKSASPYQLDPEQVERAAKGLIAHMKKHAQEKEEKADKKNLAADDDDAADQDQPIFLTVTTKNQVHNTNRLKPTKLPLPHPIIGNDVRICLFTKDPQRAYKDLVYESPAFPAALRAKIGRVVGVDKLKKKWKTFETKRQLLAEYDVFLVDDRVTKIVAECLGKTFYSTKSKRPIPVRLTAGAFVDRNAAKNEKKDVVGTAEGVAKEIQAALDATYVSMSASTNTSIKVGLMSQTPAQLGANVSAVVEKLVENHIEHKWRNVRGLYIKGPTTKALPIWAPAELWVDEGKVLDAAPVRAALPEGEKKGEKRKKWEEWEEEMLDDEDLEEKREKRAAKKNKKESPEQVKARSISKDKRNKLKQQALESVQTPLIA